MVTFFENIYQKIKTRRTAFLAGLLVVFVGLFWVASQLQFDEDISKLIPSNDDNEQLQKVLKTAQFSDKIIVNIKKEPQGTLEDMTDYATRLLDSFSLKSSNFIKEIQGTVEDETIFETLDFAFENTPLFLSENDYLTIAERTQKDSIDKIVENNYKILASPSGIVAKRTLVKDPLGISILAVQQLKQLGFNDNFELKDGFLVSKDGQNILLFITPKYKSSETNQNVLFAEQLYSFQNGLNTIFKEKVFGESFGGSLIAVANAQQIKKDIQLTMTIALLALLFLFILFYRKLTIPLILMVPTVFGGLFGIAILYLVRVEISAISLGIGAVLMGITLDYSLHILTHIRNSETSNNLFSDVATPVLMSSLTTALAFLCLLFIDSQALQDLGIFAAASVIGSSIFALIFIPQVYHGKNIESTNTNSILDKVARYNFHKSKWLLGLLAIAAVVSIFTYSNVQFNNDLSSLNYKPKTLQEAEKHLENLTNETTKSLYVIAYGNSLQEALETNDSLFYQLQTLKDSDDIIGFNSIAAVVNSKKNQQAKIDKWNQFWALDKSEQTQQFLEESGQKFGFKANSFQEFYTLLQKDFKPVDASGFQSLSSIPLQDFMASSGDFHTITSIVKVEDNQIENIKKAFSSTKNALVIDRQNLNESLLGELKTDFNKLIGYCFVVVLLLLLLFYRNIKLTLVTVIPIVITWLVTIGMIGLLNIEFNIFSILISTFVFGLGVDYSIFMTNGLMKQNNMEANHMLQTHKTSVLLSVLTTVLGIGVLIFAKHPALRSISVVSMIGILSAMLIAFTIQPLLFKLLIFDGKRQQ